MRVPSALALVVALGAAADAAPPWRTVDLATVSTATDGLLRVHGSTGDGSYGTPVAGGFDVDGDGWVDTAFASMRADAMGRLGAGIVYLVFGDGTVAGSVDTAIATGRVLQIHGAGPQEATGSEIWIDDVTGDGLGDLLIARQNHRPDAARPGAGALTILVGGDALRTHAATLAPIDLAAVPASVTAFTLVGAHPLDRLGMWARTGDVDGDGVADVAVSADQEDAPGEDDAGAVYVVRGGSHLATTATVDLAGFGTTVLAGKIAKVTPPAGSSELHFGATCQIADLDGDGKGEVLAAAALNRAGGVLTADGAPAGSAHGTGGAQDGTLYVVWDDNFPPAPWPAGLTIDLNAPPGVTTVINGGADNVSFGEEILGGLDWDDDGTADLFVGDIVGDLTGSRVAAGSGRVLYDAATLKGAVFDMDLPPPGLVTTTFLGGAFADIAADTAMQGDFDGDGVADLAFSSPHADPFGRADAGAIHVFFGRSGPWPAVVDLKSGALPDPASVRVTAIYGAMGTQGSDAGDTLCYSGAAGDLDGDGRDDIVTNEMLGDGVDPSALDVGNLLVLSGALVAGRPSPCAPAPMAGCRQAGKAKLKIVKGGDPERDRVLWIWARGDATDVTALGMPLAGPDVYGLCLYDAGGEPQPRLDASVVAGYGWEASGALGFTYAMRPGESAGIQRITLKAAGAGRARVVVKARGEASNVPALPLAFPSTANFVVDTGGTRECWEATFAAPRRNDARATFARAP